MNSNKADSMNRVLKEPKLGTSLNALTIDYSKYDLIITNPPYNSFSNKTLYKNFIIKFSKNKNCLLIPI